MGELVRSIDLLNDGRKRGYAVPAYNAYDYYSIRAILRAAELASFQLRHRS